VRPSDIHRQRHAAILAARPEVRELSGNCPQVVPLIATLVAVQCAVAVAVAGWPLAYALAAAVLFGAFVAHFLNGCIHEAAHNLILSGSARNKAVAILANLPAVAPSAMAFRHYHLLHHGFHGEPGMDADLPLAWEVNLVGSSNWRKLLWLAFLPLFYGVFHPVVVRKRFPLDRWLVANVVIVVGFAAAMLTVFGWSSFVYLAVSTYFAVGPHPTGAHILQEHVIFAGEDYETASYYGPLNATSLNLGHHVEHHDFPGVPGLRLGRLKKMAPEFYDGRYAHASRLATLWQFVCDPRASLDRRMMVTGGSR